MTHVIRVRNVHHGLREGLAHLASVGIPQASRAGEVIVAPSPVTTVYERPTERILFYPERDANPFFHVLEAAWMLAGRRDVAFPAYLVKRMATFSDDGKTLQGAYGYRWRKHFGFDQIETLIELFQTYPLTRRGVIAMWDAKVDLHNNEKATKDAPCNMSLKFEVKYGERDQPNRLNMTVFNRSNDIIMGLYGANAVHMSTLLEYIAARLGLVVGNMTTHSDNFHAYREDYLRVMGGELFMPSTPSPYELDEVAPFPLFAPGESADIWEADLADFFSSADETLAGVTGTKQPYYRTVYFASVVRPLWWAYVAYKRKQYDEAFGIIETVIATDIRRAATEWLARRREGHRARLRAELAKEVEA